jgi:hypothetical protein
MEVWIAIRNDPKARGTGTQKDPYNGSTMSMFDEVMASIPPASLIHLGRGTFRTNIQKTWQLRSGWVLQGVGMYDTIVQFGGNAAGVRQASCLSNYSWEGSADKVVVRNLCCDSNWAEISKTADNGSGGEKNIKTGAVSLGGTNNLVDGVRSINSFGSWANEQEQFAFVFGAPTGQLSVGNIARFCRAELPQGNYGAPYAMFGISKSLVSHCYAAGINNGRNGGWPTGGVNLAAIVNCEISDNTFIDCPCAYHDTDTIDGLLLQNNTVIRGPFGFMNNSPNADKNVTIRHNNFSIQNRQDGNWSLGIGNIGTGTLAGIDIEDNEILKDTTGHGVDNLFGISLHGGSNAKVLRNIVDRSNQNFVPPGTQCFGNRDANGKVVPGLEDNIAAAVA